MNKMNDLWNELEKAAYTILILVLSAIAIVLLVLFVRLLIIALTMPWP